MTHLITDLVQSLRASAEASPGKAAFSFEGRVTDFATFDRHTDQVAAALHAAGIRPGERIAYIGKNSDIFFEALYGAMKAGLVIVPVNWRLAAPEIAVIVEDSEARIILVGPEFTGLAAEILPSLPRVQIVLAAEGGHAAWPDFTAWRDAQPPTPPPHTIYPDDVAIQLYTSGTTAHPKAWFTRIARLSRM